MPRKKNKKKSNNYFTPETEEYIISYTKTDEKYKKEQIFVQYIKPAFELIVENIFNVYFKKNNYFAVSDDEVKMECLSHLSEKIINYSESISKSDTTKKGRAFGYFSVIAKNYFIQKNKKMYKELNRHYPILQDSNEESISGTNNNITEIEDESYNVIENGVDHEVIVLKIAKKVEEQIPVLFDNDRDRRIALSVVNLLEINKMLDNFNKKAIFLYLREMTGEKSQRITGVLNTLKDIYPKMYLEVYNESETERFWHDHEVSNETQKE